MDAEDGYRSDGIEAVREVVSWYVGQLLHGCGDADCTESLCATGARNVSSRPTRGYTPRSARAIALTLASGSNPRARLCPRYRYHMSHGRTSHDKKGEEVAEGPRDPLSMMQQLHDTPAIRQICEPLEERDGIGQHSRNRVNEYTAYKRITTEVNSAMDTLENLETPPSDEQIAEICTKGIRLLLSCLSLQNEPPWSLFLCDILVKQGNSAISRKISAPGGQWATIVDTMGLEPYTRTFLRILRLIVEGPTYTHISSAVDKGPALLTSVCEYFAARASEAHAASLEVSYLCIWLKKIFLTRWRGTAVLDGPEYHCLLFLSFLAEALSRTWPATSVASLILLPVVANILDAQELANTWLEWLKSHGDQGSQHILLFRRIFAPNQLITYFRTINHLRMQKAHSSARKALAVREQSESWVEELTPVGQLKWLEEHYLLLSVSRCNVLHDAFDQLWERRKGELLRPLRVRLGEIDALEVGHDLGGVQIEFFNLVCKQLFNHSAQMFSTNLETGYSYFTPGSLQPLYMFELAGLLFSLAVYNGITLPVSLPLAFYHQLLDGHYVDMINDYWPEVSRSFTDILKGEVGAVDMVFPLEANGLRLEISHYELSSVTSGRSTMHVHSATAIVHHENKQIFKDSKSSGESASKTQPVSTEEILAEINDSWPGWRLVACSDEPSELTNENASTYVKNYTKWLIHDSVAPQLCAFKRGFYYCLNFSTLDTLFTAESLRHLVEGSQKLDLAELRQTTEYDGYDGTSRYINSFWNILASWPMEKQKQLVKFVTAAERIPAGGAGQLTFKITRSYPGDMDDLPRSSTCFGTLMLPRYATPEILEEKLNLALKYGLEGFGTG